MLKYIYTIRKRKDISDYEFRQNWQDETFRELFRKAVSILGGAQLTMSLVLDIEYNRRMNEVRDCEVEPFDALVEYLFPNAASLNERSQSEEFQRVFNELERYQESFVDFKRSSRFFVDYTDATCPEPQLIS